MVKEFYKTDVDFSATGSLAYTQVIFIKQIILIPFAVSNNKCFFYSFFENNPFKDITTTTKSATSEP